MAYSLPTIALSVLLILLLNHPFAGAAKTSDLVTKTCRTTTYPDICTSMLASDPRSAGATDTTALSRVAIQVAASNANQTFTYVNNLVKNETDYGRWAKLVLCQDVYNSSAYGVGTEGLKAFDAKNFTGAYESLGSANSGAHECDNMGLDMLAHRNNVMVAFTNVTMSILSSLF